MDRISRLQDRLAAQETDFVAVGPGAHMDYLLGFHPHPDERPCLLMVSRSGAGMLMPALNAEAARTATDLPFWAWKDADGPGAALDAAFGDLGVRNAGRIGLDETMRTDFALMLIDALPNADRRLASDSVGHLRLHKDEAEIAALKENAAIADAAQQAVRAAVRPGITENELADVARKTFAEHGAKTIFTIVGAGPNGAYPHHHTGDTVVKAGDAIVVDIGGCKGIYPSDITRMVSCGTPPEGYQAVHDVVNAAVEAALAVIKPGCLARDVDAAARSVITEAGYGEYFVHRTGHGLGIEVHEPPYITATADTVLNAGMVFSVEPGIYLPGRFGIRLEEIVVVRETGPEVLSALPRDLHVA